MTPGEVEAIVRREAVASLSIVSHGITLAEALVRPRQIVLIDRIVRDGRMTDRKINAWLIGQEHLDGGYMIVMRESDLVFGLASHGFPNDEHPILTGWYGSLVSTFEGM